MVLVGLAADSIVVVVLGSQWRAAIPVVQILCVAGAVQLLFLPVGEVMKAAGKGAWLLWWTVGFTVLLVCAVFVGAHRGGLEGVAIGYLSGHLLALPAGLHILRLLAGVRLWELVVALRGIAMALVCEGAAIAVSRHFTDPYSLGGLVIVVGCAAAGYLFVLRLADRGVIRYSFGRRVM
jgi:O-antigen/teichoic acid export membrane protein